MKRNFDDFISAYMEFTNNHESTKRIQLWTCISIIAAALERKVWMDRGYYTLFPNLYIFIIAKSGLVKKSTSTAIGVNLLRELPDIKFMSERLTAASLVKQMAEAKKKFQLQGEEIKQSPLYAYSSELAVLMGEVYGSIIELLTSFYDCIPNDPEKPWTNKAKHEDQIRIHGPCLNILGASTKEWLKKCIPDKEMYGGFTSRVVFVVEDNAPDRLVAWPEISSDMAKHRLKLVEDLYYIGQLAGSVKIKANVKQRFKDWYYYHMKQIVPNVTDKRFMGYMSRKGDLMLKLSMIRSVSLGNSLEIDLAAFEWAGRQIELIEPDMMAAFSHTRQNLTGVTNFTVLNYLKMKGPTSMTDLVSHFKVNDKQLGKILTALIENLSVNFEAKGKDGLYKAR